MIDAEGEGQKIFAEEYQRNESGFILFPQNDEKYRKQLFGFWDRLDISLSVHPAKANLYLVESIVKYVSEPGETIMDVMSGTGTILVGALLGRNIICIEIESEFQHLIEEGIKDVEKIVGEDFAMLIPGDCYLVLPVPGIDHVVFSPPYAAIMKKKVMDKLSAETGTDGLLNYSKNPNNISNLNEFMYHQKMERIYKKILESLRPGGTLTIIIKDHIDGGKRMMLGERAIRDCIEAGFELLEQYKWVPKGSVYLNIKRARGDMVVEDEDIIIMRKPE